MRCSPSDTFIAADAASRKWSGSIESASESSESRECTKLGMSRRVRVKTSPPSLLAACTSRKSNESRDSRIDVSLGLMSARRRSGREVTTVFTLLSTLSKSRGTQNEWIMSLKAVASERRTHLVQTPCRNTDHVHEAEQPGKCMYHSPAETTTLRPLTRSIARLKRVVSR